MRLTGTEDRWVISNIDVPGMMAVAFCDDNGYYELGEWEISIDPPTPEMRKAALAILKAIDWERFGP